MRYSDTVLFSDLDGTLFNSAGEVSRENQDLIRAYMAQGGRFAIATGRQPDNAKWYWPDPITNAPSIVLNGAAVYDFNTGAYSLGRYLGRPAMDAVLRRVMETLPQADIQVYTATGIHYITPEDRAHRRFWELHRPCDFVPLEALEGQEVFKCLLFDPTEEKTLSALLAAGAGDAYRVVPGTTDVGGVVTYFEMIPEGISKGSELDALRSHPDLAGRTFLAVGDYWNDYELLTAADISIAPANAIEEIRAICQYVTAANTEHAIARIIDTLIPAL